MQFAERFVLTTRLDKHSTPYTYYNVITDMLTGNQTTCSMSLLTEVSGAIKRAYETKEYRESKYPYPQWMKVVAMWEDSSDIKGARAYVKTVFLPTRYLKGRQYTMRVKDIAREVAITAHLRDASIEDTFRSMFKELCSKEMIKAGIIKDGWEMWEHGGR